MSVYYVSTQRGNDNNDGLSQLTPFSSITKACQKAMAGDTVYVGSGIYRERPSIVNAGISTAYINFIGDSESQYLTSDVKGVVRVTGCDVNENPTSGDVWVCSKNYISISNFSIDGSSNGFCINFSSGANTGGKCTNIVCHGYGGIQFGNCYNCFFICSEYGCNMVNNCINCLSISYTGFESCQTVKNCIAIGGNFGFDASISNSKTSNCIALGCAYGFQADGDLYNCLSISCSNGFYFATKIVSNCCAMYCNTGYYIYGTPTMTNCKQYGCRTPISAYSTLPAGLVISDGMPMFFNLQNYFNILKAIEPYNGSGLMQWGNNTVDAGTSDILGRDRLTNDGGIDIGAYAISNVGMDYNNFFYNSPSITITRKGNKMFDILANTNEKITVSVNVMYTGNITQYPQIKLMGKSISTQIKTSTVGYGEWDTLSVSATPTIDECLTLVLCSQDVASDSITYFSDITIT